MIKDFILPDIGEGIVECELVEWLIKEGDLIEEDQPVADVMTDKALVQIPAPHAGRVTKLYYQQGDNAKVHTPLFAVDIEESAVGSVASTAATPSVAAAPVVAQTVPSIQPDAAVAVLLQRIVLEPPLILSCRILVKGSSNVKWSSGWWPRAIGWKKISLSSM